MPGGMINDRPAVHRRHNNMDEIGKELDDNAPPTGDDLFKAAKASVIPTPGSQGSTNSQGSID